MEENKINSTPLHSTTQSSPWLAAITCSALLLLVAIGATIVLREKLVFPLQEQAKTQAIAQEKLATRLTHLQAALDTLPPQTASAAPSTTDLEPLLAKLDASTKLVEQLSARVEVMEKTAEEKKLAPPAVAPSTPPTSTAPSPQLELTALSIAALSGKPFAPELTAWLALHPKTEDNLIHLQSFAADGIISEATLIQQLLALVNTKQEPEKMDDTSTIGKINTHLKGLVSIKKSAPTDNYYALRKAATHNDLTSIQHEVERLDAADREPLNAWLTLAKNRRAALDELSSLTSVLGH